ALPNGEDSRLLRKDEIAPLSADVEIVSSGQLLQVLEVALRQHGRLIGLGEDGEVLLQPLDLLRSLGVDALAEFLEAFAPVLEQEFDLAAIGVTFHRLHDELESPANGLQLHRIELLLLDQNLLAHSNLAEIVEQRCI